MLGSVELDWLAARGTLYFFVEPGSKAHQVEDVTAAKLLPSLDVAEADAALVGRGALLVRSVHILQLSELLDELAPLE